MHFETLLIRFQFPQTTCIAHVEMNHCCPQKPCTLELVESCAVSHPKGLLSVKYPPTENTGPLETFLLHKVSYSASKISSFIKFSQRLRSSLQPLSAKPDARVGFFPKALLEVWDFLWNKFCNLRATVRQSLRRGGTGLLGGFFTPNSRCLSVRDLKTGGRLTGIYPVNNIWRERSRQTVEIFNSYLLILGNRHNCNE